MIKNLALGLRNAAAVQSAIRNPQSEIRKDIVAQGMENTMASEKTAPVAVVMGSDSDLSIMQSCVDQLREFGIEPTVRILSAHRTPQAAAEFAQTAEARGVKVVIAAAGMAAHLAGAMAAWTTLPVIGVPLTGEGGLAGLDALLSTVQMPPGVPVAAVAIGKAGAKNAAILAVQILALADPALRDKLLQFRKRQEQRVREKDAGLA
jgi:phosphoribosylaminoimidazole carboxylase PurE protein